MEDVEEAEEEEVGREEMKEVAAKVPHQPLKKLRCGLGEETPACHSTREFRGSSQKSPGLQIPLIVPPSARRRNAPMVAP